METAPIPINYEYDELSWVVGGLRVQLIFTIYPLPLSYLQPAANNDLFAPFDESRVGSLLFLTPLSLSLNLNPIVSNSLSGYVRICHSHMRRKEAVCKWESSLRAVISLTGFGGQSNTLNHLVFGTTHRALLSCCIHCHCLASIQQQLEARTKNQGPVLALE